MEPSLGRAYGVVTAAQLLSTLVLLPLELRSKRAVLLMAYRGQPPEAITSFLGNWVFSWVNPILRKGYTKILSEQETPALEEHMSSKALRLAIRTAWDTRGAFDTNLGALVLNLWEIMFTHSKP